MYTNFKNKSSKIIQKKGKQFACNQETRRRLQKLLENSNNPISIGNEHFKSRKTSSKSHTDDRVLDFTSGEDSLARDIKCKLNSDRSNNCNR